MQGQLSQYQYRQQHKCIYLLFLIVFLLQNNMTLIRKILPLILFILITQSLVTVNQITGVTNDNLVYSGTIPVSASTNLFFTYYGVDGQKDQNSLKNYPLLIVVGNPGVSAQYYSLAGIGPVNLNNLMALTPNPNRFTNIANLMFIDLPASGFSFVSDVSGIPTEAKAYAAQLSIAINAFAKESVLGQSQKIILAGQGTFIRSVSGLGDIANLKGVIHLSIWPEIYAIGRFYGIAGVEMKIYAEAERIAIDSTFTSCYNYVRSQKFMEAHQCLETILNFVQSKTKNTNLYDVRLNSSLSEFLPMIQSYFSQPATVTAWKAPANKLFQSQSGYVSSLTFSDLAKNYTKNISGYMKDYFSVKQWFIGGQSDYVSYYKGVRNWMENELSFVQSDAFKKAKLEDILVDGKLVGYGKAVKQVAYTELLNSGHHLLHDDANTLNALFKIWVESLTESSERNISLE